VRVDDVCLLRDVTQSTGDLAAKPQPHETLNELVNAEQQRQRTDDQLASRAHPTQRLDSHSSNHRASHEVSLR
jgi:hypothetical protein